MVTSWTDEGAFSPSARVEANVTATKALHINELKAAVDVERARRSTAAYPWSGFPAVAGAVSGLLKTYIEQLRLSMVGTWCPTDYTPAPSWTDTSLIVDATPDKTAHINELRIYLNTLESVSCLCNCNGHCSCNCNGHCR